MKPRWKRNGVGEYTLTLSSGASAWITRSVASRNQPTWYGRAFVEVGESVKISAWKLGIAKQLAERALENK